MSIESLRLTKDRGILTALANGDRIAILTTKINLAIKDKGCLTGYNGYNPATQGLLDTGNYNPLMIQN